MSTETKSSALAQHGPILGPVIGVVIALGLILAAAFTGNVAEERDRLNSQISVVNSQRASDTPREDLAELPVLGNIAPVREEPLARTEAGDLKPMTALPLGWQVVIQAREAVVDNGNGDNGLTMRDDFDALDLNEDGVLTAPDEISWEQVDQMDYSDNGHVTWEDYQRYRNDGPVSRYEFGDPRNVEVAVDPNNMEVLVTWSAPAIGDMPPDMGYIIERRAPQTVERRRRAWRQDLGRYNDDLLQWEQGRDEWLRGAFEEGDRALLETTRVSSEQIGQRRRDVVPRTKWNDVYARASGTAMPQEPQEPEEWERVTDSPVSGTEFRDNTIELDVTYTYAVRATTQSRLRRGVESNQEFMPGYQVSGRSTQTGRPVLVGNRISISRMSTSSGGATLRLGQWLRHSSGGRVNWYRITIEERVADDGERRLGANYTLAQLEERNATLRSTIGQEVPLRDVLAEDARVNFESTFEYVTNMRRNILLTSPTYGDFVLPSETENPAEIESDSAGMTNPIEVMVYAVGDNGSNIYAKVTRWVDVEGDWYRVVMTGSVNRGSSVGRSVTLGSLGSGDNVQVFDSSGNVVTAATLRGELLRGVTVDLSAGEYEGIRGRVITIGGEEMDIFGVLYTE
jgi:hypothetical protein